MKQFYTITRLSTAAFADCAEAISPLRVPIEQTPVWGKFDNATKHRAFLGSFRYDDKQGRLVAILSATLYQQKGRDWIWIKHGPLFASVPNTETITKILATLGQQFSQVNHKKPLFIRLSMPERVKPLVIPFEHTMYTKTVKLDLTQDLETIRMAMSQSARQSIKKATENGVTVIEIPKKQAAERFTAELYPILHETASRSNFGIHPTSLYETMLNTLSGHIHLYVAYHQKKAVAWAILTQYQEQALYYYGASNHAGRELHAPYLLQWHCIQVMKQRGITTYDLMGIASKEYPSLQNVTQFKTKFSKDIIDMPQTYDLPLRPLRYRAITGLLKMNRKIR